MKNLRCVFVFLAVMGLAGLALGAGCGSDAAPAAVPDPISVNTLDGGDGVPVDSTFKYVFPRPVNTLNVTKSTFFIVKNEPSPSLNKAVVDGGICDSTQAIDTTGECSSPTECTLTPAELLEYSTTYSICLTGNMQYDTGEQFGNFMATFTAEVEGPLDLNNLDGAVDVPVDSSFRYRFLKEIDTSTVDTSTYFIVPTVDPATCDSANAVDSEITCTRWSCTIAPSEYLEYITGYTACLASGISYTSSFTFNGFMAGFTTPVLPSPTNLGLSVVNHRAAQIELSWDSSSDIPSEWENVRQAEVRCVEDEPITMANWDTAMQFADDPISGASPINWTMLVAEDVSGNKIRAGYDYYCGIRGRSIIDNQWSSLMTFGVIAQADLDFVQYPLVIEGYTWGYSAHIAAAGDVNGDGYDDMLVGYGDGTGHGAAIYFGGVDGPTAAASQDISCADSSFGRVITGIGDFDGAAYSAGDATAYPDIAVSAPKEDAVYIFRGHAGMATSPLSCGAADIVILGTPGTRFGYAVQALGDFDGDGLADIAIGAPYTDGYDGKVFVVFGRDEGSYPVTIDLVTGTLARGALEIEAPFATSFTGFGLAAGDFDLDDHWDLVFASSWGGAAFEGSFSILHGYVVSKPVNAVTPVAAASLDQVVEFSYPGVITPQFGHTMAPMDFDGDGCLDLVVGAERANIGAATLDAAGNVFVYLGENSGGACTGTMVEPYTLNIHGEADWDTLGYPVVPPLNLTIAVPEYWRLNGLLSSPTDLAIIAGAQQYHGGGWTTGVGFVGLWYAGFSGDVTPSQADILISGGTGAGGQHWAAFVGDLDGDGYVDLAIGDPDYGSAGRVYVYH